MKNKIPSTMSLLALSLVFAGNAYAQNTLWNINFAGRSGLVRNVANGLVLNAGSIGSDQWNNVASPTTSTTWDPASPISILDSSGANSINLDWTGPIFKDFSSNSGNTSSGTLTDLNRGWYGFGNFDSTLQFSGLDSGASYDIYVYFTWQWNETAVDYTITQGSGTTTNLTLNPQHSSAISYASYVDGSEGTPGNYVVFQNISPDLSGVIGMNALSGDGGFSAIQLVQVPEPSTYVLLFSAITMTGTLLIRRRRKATSINLDGSQQH